MDAADLPELVRPFAFVLGTWRGEGVGGYPSIEEDFPYGEEITFSCYGKPIIEFHSKSWSLDDDRPLARQSGFWRPLDDNRMEAVIAVASGLVEVFYGELVNGPAGVHVEMTTDLIGHTASAKRVDADKRLYAVRGGKLMYAMEMSAMGHAMQPHLSAALDAVV